MVVSPKTKKFEPKDGDVIVSGGDVRYVAIFKAMKNEYSFYYYALLVLREGTKPLLNNWAGFMDTRPATEEEKQKLFDTIKENGYKWNSETRTLEKLIESKEDTDDTNDEVVVSGIYFDRTYHADEVELHLNDYKIEIRDGKTYDIFNKIVKPKFKVGNRIKVIGKTYQYVIKEITDTHYTLEEVEDKFQYIEPIIEDKNWELFTDKFDITTLKPFDKVLVRDFDNTPWEIEFFSRLLNGEHFKCLEVSYVQCIPYEGNQHLLGTKNDCSEFYKTW
jgi:hypothetical protein